MPYRREQLAIGEIYHVMVRRLENHLLFKDINDYYRGIFSIYEFNTTESIIIRERRKIRTQLKKAIRDPLSDIDRERVSAALSTDHRDKLVEVLLFCLMPNHLHLLLRQLKDGGITTFMNKIGAGYPAYFKQKYGIKTKGYFFQGRFVSVHIKTDSQLRTVFVYIHTNPISLIEPKWKEIGIQNSEKVIKFVENYKWSSYLDYIGGKNFPSITDREFLSEVIGKKQGCQETVRDWIKYKGEIKEFPETALE